MLKKLFITMLCTLSLVTAGVTTPFALAQDGASVFDKTVNAIEGAFTGGTGPSEDVGSTEFMFDLGAVTHEDIREQNVARQGINFIFQRIITIMAVSVGSAAVFIIVLGGFFILSSGGIQERIDTGKNMIKKAIIGLVAVLGAYILVTTVQFLINSIYG